MKSILLFIQTAAPLLFLLTVSAYIIIKIILLWIHIQLNRFERDNTQIDELLAVQDNELSDFEDMLTKLESSGKKCTKDDPNVGCVKVRIAKFRADIANIQERAQRIKRRLKYIELLLKSPLGKLLAFVGNIDSPKERRQS